MITVEKINQSRELLQKAIMCLYDRNKDRKHQQHDTIIMLMDNIVDLLDDAIETIEENN